MRQVMTQSASTRQPKASLASRANFAGTGVSESAGVPRVGCDASGSDRGADASDSGEAAGGTSTPRPAGGSDALIADPFLQAVARHASGIAVQKASAHRQHVDIVILLQSSRQVHCALREPSYVDSSPGEEIDSINAFAHNRASTASHDSRR